MKITFASDEHEFRPWKPTFGRVFTGTVAFDCETARISDKFPWLTPPFVIGASFDGAAGFFVTREHAPTFFEAHPDIRLVLHNATFDLAVLALLCGDPHVSIRSS